MKTFDKLTDDEYTNFGAGSRVAFFDRAYARAPNCTSTDHPTCPVCAPERNWLCYRLTAEAQDLYDRFMYTSSDACCSCHLSPPCGYCVDEGNPANLLENETDWELSTDINRISYDWLLDNSTK